MARTDDKEAPPSGSAVHDDSDTSCYATEDEEDTQIHLGPKISIKEHLEKDKDDESLRKWKEQLLGSVDVSQKWHKSSHTKQAKAQHGKDADERLQGEIAISNKASNHQFVLSILRMTKETTIDDSIKLCAANKFKELFTSRLGIFLKSYPEFIAAVDSSKEMLGTFGPQAEPYIHAMPEEVTPSGMFARGNYSAKTKFVDDDNKCYLELNYTFDIQKDWAKGAGGGSDMAVSSEHFMNELLQENGTVQEGY
ncbi:Rho GDP-dissociation inhibitor 1-like protein [Tanacetum coccineum]